MPTGGAGPRSHVEEVRHRGPVGVDLPLHGRHHVTEDVLVELAEMQPRPFGAQEEPCASVASVVKTQIVIDSVASKLSSCT